MSMITSYLGKNAYSKSNIMAEIANWTELDPLKEFEEAVKKGEITPFGKDEFGEIAYKAI